MSALGPQSLNVSRSWRLVLSGRDGATLLGAFTGDETFSGRIWPGDDRESLVTLAPRWATEDDAVSDDEAERLALNPAELADPEVVVPVTAALIADLAPGLYWLQVLINPGTDDLEVACRLIEFTAAPGDAEPEVAWPTFDDCRRVLPSLPDLIAADPSMQSDLLEQRAEATRWLKHQLLSRYRESLARLTSGLSPVAASDLALLAYLRDTHEWDALAALAALAASLDDAELAEDRTARDITALYAVYLACDGQPGEMREGWSWRDEGRHHRAKARAMLRGWAPTFTVAEDADGPDVELGY